MEADESSIVLESTRITGLESQILNSQEIIVRLNRELDSALLRITTLENVCSENQNDLHEKRSRIKELNDEINEREEINERLVQELSEKDERLTTLDDLITQLKQHIKQAKQENEETDENINGDSLEHPDLRSQILFDRQLRELILHDLHDDDNSSNRSPQAIIDQYHNNQRLKFHNLLETSLTIDDISNLIDSDDVLFEILTHLNSLMRLKETLSRDSMKLQHIYSLLHLTNDNTDEVIQDLINKRECLEYLRAKVDNNQDLTDFDLVKHVLHDYFDFQQQQIELKEYLHPTDDLNYSRVLIERYTEAIHVTEDLNKRIQHHEDTIEQLKNQLDEFIKETIEREEEIDEIVSKFCDQLIDEDTSEISHLNRIRSTLQSNADFRQALLSETSGTSNEDVLQYIREYKSNHQTLSENHLEQDQELLINGSKEEANEPEEITNSLELHNDDDKTQVDFIRSSLDLFSEELSLDNNIEAISSRIHDYQLIINELQTDEHTWTDNTTDDLISKLKSMKIAENTVDDLQKELQNLADQFAPIIENDEESHLIRLGHILQSLTNFRQELLDETQMNTDEEILQFVQTSKENNIQLQEFLNRPIQEKQDVELQTTNDDEIDLEKLRSLLNIKDENLVECVAELTESFNRLKDEYEIVVQKEDNIDQSIERMLTKLGLSSNSSTRTKIDEICAIFDKFCLEYCQLISTDIETMNLIEVFKHVQVFLTENNQLKVLIEQINFDQSSESLDYKSKLQTYLTKVDTLCRLIDDDNGNIDQALVNYQEKAEHDQDINQKISDFKQELLRHLSIDNEEEIFDRLTEMEHMITNLKEKSQKNDDSTSTLTSLNLTVSEQHNKIIEHEETLEKLRSQRERMLSKMKDMKTNNETLTNQLNLANQSVVELHKKEIEYQNRIEELDQQLRSIHNQMQVSLDECRTQQDLQETMKIENESIKNEIETQRKLYESRCRQIITEKNQLEKNRKELFEQKQIIEDDNKRLQTLLQTIKDNLENVDDVNSIVDTILKLRQDHLILTNKLNQRNEQIHIEKEELLLNIHQQQSTLNEHREAKSELEKRLTDDEQQILNLKQEIEEKNNQYQRLQNEYQLYKEEYQIKKIDSQVATINIEQSPPPLQPHLLPVQQAAESNNWMAIDMADEEIPMTTTNKHSTMDTQTAFFNMLGELKSKLGITLTHRPRSSSDIYSRFKPNMPLVFREIQADLFSSSASLAHCVSMDMVMSKGIAKIFRDKFRQVDELKKQNVPVGGCAFIQADDRHIFYLVTKEKYFHKPTMNTLESSLRQMRDLCIENKINQLAMPRIGCGLDRLNWDRVSGLIQRIFQEDDIEITIYTI